MNTRTYRLALKEAQRQNPDLSGADLDEAVDEVLLDWAAEAAHDREVYGEPDDTPCLESCDQWGTGEGRYHGVIG